MLVAQDGQRVHSHHIDDQGNIGMVLPVRIEKTDVLLIHNDAVHLSKVKDVGDIFLLQTVVDRDNHSSRGNDSVDGFQESRSVGRKNTDASVGMLLEIVGKATGAIGKFTVGPSQDSAVNGDVEDSLGVGLNRGSALKKDSWRESMEVRRVLRLRAEMVEDRAQTRGRARHFD